jgi:hypothetical protein
VLDIGLSNFSPSRSIYSHPAPASRPAQIVTPPFSSTFDLFWNTSSNNWRARCQKQLISMKRSTYRRNSQSRYNGGTNFECYYVFARKWSLSGQFPERAADTAALRSPRGHDWEFYITVFISESTASIFSFNDIILYKRICCRLDIYVKCNRTIWTFVKCLYDLGNLLGKKLNSKHLLLK